MATTKRRRRLLLPHPRRLQRSNKTLVASDIIGPGSCCENYIPSPPDGGWGWVIVVASLFCNMIVDGLGYSFGVFLLEFADYFQESKSKVSLVGSVMAGSYNVVGPVVSGLTNKLGCRPVAVAGSVIASLAFLLSTFATSVDILILTYGVLGGFGLGMIYLPAIVSVGHYFQKKRALATGIALCGSGIGTFIFAPLSQYLLEEMDWKSALMFISGITLNGAVCGMLMRPLKPSGSSPRMGRSEKALTRNCKNRYPAEHRAARFSMGDSKAVTVRAMEARLQQVERSNLAGDPVPSTCWEQLPPPTPTPPSSSQQQQQKQQMSHSNYDWSSTKPHTNTLTPPLYGYNAMSSGFFAEERRSTVNDRRQLSHRRGCSQISELAVTTTIDIPEATTSTAISAAPPFSAKREEGRAAACLQLFVDNIASFPPSPVPGNDVEHTGGHSNKEPGCGEGLSFFSASTADDVTPSGASSLTLVKQEVTTRSVTPDYNSKTEESSQNVFALARSASDTSPVTKRSKGQRLACLAKYGFVLRKSDTELSKLSHRLSTNCKTSVPSNLKYYVQMQDTTAAWAESKSTKTPTVKRQRSTATVVVSPQASDEKSNAWRLDNAPSPMVACGQSLQSSLSVAKKDLARPLYRKDIFYSGSVQHLPEFQAHPDMRSYITSITTIPKQTDLVADEDETKVWRCMQCCPQSFRDTLQEMLDLSLLKDTGFLLVCIGNVLAFLGFYVPFVYCVDLAVSLEIDKSKAVFLISIIGITNTLGRVVTGWLADLRRIDSLVITYVSIFICGVCTAIFPFCQSYGLLCVAASLFGLSVAAFISLTSILICDLLGLEKLTNGFGLLSLFRGMAAMAGPPLAGFVFDQTQSYKASFFMGGALMTLGSLCHLFLKLPCALRKEPEVFHAETLTIVEEVPLPVINEMSESVIKPDMVALEEVF